MHGRAAEASTRGRHFASMPRSVPVREDKHLVQLHKLLILTNKLFGVFHKIVMTMILHWSSPHNIEPKNLRVV